MTENVKYAELESNEERLEPVLDVVATTAPNLFTLM